MLLLCAAVAVLGATQHDAVQRTTVTLALNVCPDNGGKPGLFLVVSSTRPSSQPHIVPAAAQGPESADNTTIVPCGTSLRTITNGRVLHDLGSVPCTEQTWSVAAVLTEVPFVELGPDGDTHTTYVYAVSDAGLATLLGHATSGQDCGTRGASVDVQRRVAGPYIGVGILYEGWHTFAAAAYAQIKSMGGVQVSLLFIFLLHPKACNVRTVTHTVLVCCVGGRLQEAGSMQPRPSVVPVTTLHVSASLLSAHC